MRTEALFINREHESVLLEILQIQAELPEHIMYLPPYPGGAITHLQDDRPMVENPMLLVLSLMSDRAMIHFTAEIVGWSDKCELSHSKLSVLNRVIGALQPRCKELYDASHAANGESVNLLYIRRLRRLNKPFSVVHLVKRDGMPVSEQQTTPGWWTYIRADNLAEFLW